MGRKLDLYIPESQLDGRLGKSAILAVGHDLAHPHPFIRVQTDHTRFDAALKMTLESVTIHSGGVQLS